MGRTARTLAPCAPYLAVGIGLHVARSAWAAMLGYHACMCLVLWAGGGWPEARRALRGWGAWGIAVVLLCALAGPLLWLLWPLVGAGPLVDTLARVGLGGRSFHAFAVYYILANPVLEEIYWRGWLAAPTRSPDATDALFAGYHALVLVLFIGWPWVLLCVACIACASWIWRRIARSTGGLLVPVIAHLAADVGVIAAALVLISC